MHAQNPLGPLRLIHRGECPMGFLGACMLKIISDIGPCMLKTPSDIAPDVLGGMVREVLGALMLKTHSDLAPMYKAEGSEGFWAVHAQNPLGRCPLCIRRKGFEGVLGRACSKPPRTLSPMYKAERVRGGFWGVHAQNPLGPCPYV